MRRRQVFRLGFDDSDGDGLSARLNDDPQRVVNAPFRSPARLVVDLRDLIWAPAKLLTGPTFRSRDLGEILLPAVSPLSWQHPDEEVKLGRVTEWCEDEAGDVAPFGSKTWLVDGDEFPLLEVRELEIYSAAGGVEDAPD